MSFKFVFGLRQGGAGHISVSLWGPLVCVSYLGIALGFAGMCILFVLRVCRVRIAILIRAHALTETTH